MENENLNEIKECIAVIRWSDGEGEYDKVIECAEKMADRIEELERSEKMLVLMYNELQKDLAAAKPITCSECKKYETEDCSRRHWDDNYIQYFYPEKDDHCKYAERKEVVDGKHKPDVEIRD